MSVFAIDIACAEVSLSHHVPSHCFLGPEAHSVLCNNNFVVHFICLTAEKEKGVCFTVLIFENAKIDNNK